MQTGALAPAELMTALSEQGRSGATLDRVVVAEALASPATLRCAQSRHWHAPEVDRATTPPDAALSGLLPPEFCLRHAVLPWSRLAGVTVIATARPEGFDAMRAALPADFGPVTMALALEADIHAEIAERHGAALAHRAETWLHAEDSSRDINRFTPLRATVALGFGGACLTGLALAPQLFFALVVLCAVLSLVVAQGLKCAALLASRPTPQPARSDPALRRYPSVSILVPLFHEDNIVQALVTRLARLTYPKAMLDVILVLEETDGQTRAALAETRLPPWMRVVEVPAGAVQTKPRALNYALRFCHGEIVGIYDAEDAPAPDQIDRITAAFARLPPEVACLQGMLDFYNPRANWLSRCFAIEYASWFRILLPGLARLGFAVPLGGTTVFFRRDALEDVRGWDAHNVTEDADLGIRLARHGYRTELLGTVTREEANNRAWPWIKQRSRWLKGYMVTYLVHMRRPAKLWRDLGGWRFWGFQALFLTAILQFLLAPALWSFWLVLFGWDHPVTTILGPVAMLGLIALFLLSEAVSLIIGIAAVARSPHDRLMRWVPTMLLYFPLGVVAAYKAVWEVLARPFYWDKTAHGHSLPDLGGPE